MKSIDPRAGHGGAHRKFHWPVRSSTAFHGKNAGRRPNGGMTNAIWTGSRDVQNNARSGNDQGHIRSDMLFSSRQHEAEKCRLKSIHTADSGPVQAFSLLVRSPGHPAPRRHTLRAPGAGRRTAVPAAGIDSAALRADHSAERPIDRPRPKPTRSTVCDPIPPICPPICAPWTSSSSGNLPNRVPSTAC